MTLMHLTEFVYIWFGFFSRSFKVNFPYLCYFHSKLRKLLQRSMFFLYLIWCCFMKLRRNFSVVEDFFMFFFRQSNFVRGKFSWETFFFRQSALSPLFMIWLISYLNFWEILIPLPFRLKHIFSQREYTSTFFVHLSSLHWGGLLFLAFKIHLLPYSDPPTVKLHYNRVALGLCPQHAPNPTQYLYLQCQRSRWEPDIDLHGSPDKSMGLNAHSRRGSGGTVDESIFGSASASTGGPYQDELLRWTLRLND